MQKRGFIGRSQSFVLQQLLNFVFAEFVVHLVRKVARIYERFVADAFHRVSGIGFVAFAPDEDPAGIDMPGDVIAYLLPLAEFEEALSRAAKRS